MANSTESITFMCNCLYSAVKIMMVLQLTEGTLGIKSKQGTKKQKQFVLSINI